ncbi:MAG: hypothetical protein OCC45_12960 [Desulfotalea sp.]
MDFKNLNKSIREELSKGRTREELFAEGCSQASTGQEKKIAFAIACVPEEEYRRDFAKTNLILTILLVLDGIFCILTEFPLAPENSLIFSLVKVASPFVFCFFTYKFYGAAYRFIAIWSLLDLLSTSVLTIAKTPDNFVLFKILIVFTVMALSWYIARKVFPHMGVLGVKKDANGTFLI